MQEEVEVAEGRYGFVLEVPVRVDVWSDVMCPWCAIGRARLEKAVAAFSETHDESIEVRWRAFELDPSAPRQVEGDYVALLGRKYGRSKAEAQQMVDAMAERGAEDGLSFDFTRIRPGNTFDAHRLLHHAFEHGLQDALKARLFRAYFEEGRSVSDPDALVALAVDVGLDEAAVREVLGSDAHAEGVRAEEMLAQRLGVSGVPFFVIDERVAVSGAQPAELLTQALAHALDSREVHESEVENGESCGPDGCAV